MKVLVVAGTYPHAGHLFSGVFNEKCAVSLSQLCEHVEVLCPRPYVPAGFGFIPRWKSYGEIKRYECRNGISVHRPATPMIPKIGAGIQVDLAPFLSCVAAARRIHRDAGFDAIVSFDLVQAGGVAWRLGRRLGIPAAGWAFGSDIRHPKHSALGKVASRAIRTLDLVFYQSRELLKKAEELLGIPVGKMPKNQHIVLAHGIAAPPNIARDVIRKRVRQELGIHDNHVLCLYTGRIFQQKGIFELLEATSIATKHDNRIICAMVGSNPAYDQTNMLEAELGRQPELKNHVRLLPACPASKIWEYLCAADIFVFPSHNEGMPNSLLEAMAMGVPCIAFAIPPIQEVEASKGSLVLVPPLVSECFAQAIVRLAGSPLERTRIGEIGKLQVFDRFLVQKNMAIALEHLKRIIGGQRKSHRRVN